MGSFSNDFVDLLNNKGTATLVLGVGIGLGIAIGWMFKPKLPRGMRSSSDDLSHPLVAAETGEYKMVIVVRTDLKMGKGKVAAQCAHAAVSGAEKAFRVDQAMLMRWRGCGQPKVVVKTETEASLLLIAKKAYAQGLLTSVIKDAGRTQIAPGSLTVLGVGPGPAELVDKVTGHLKLL